MLKKTAVGIVNTETGRLVPVTLEMIYERQALILSRLDEIEEAVGEVSSHVAEVAIDSGSGFSTTEFD